MCLTANVLLTTRLYCMFICRYVSMYIHMWCTLCRYIHTVQLTSKLTLAWGKHTCVLQFLSYLKSKHVCDTKWAAREQLSRTALKLFFVCCTWVIIRVMHDSKKHASNALCAARESVFLCAACKLTAVFYQKRIKAYNEKAPCKSDKTCGHEENNILSSIYAPLL